MAATRKIRLVVETPDVIRVYLDDGEVIEYDKKGENAKIIDELKHRFADPDGILDRHLKASAAVKWPRERVKKLESHVKRGVVE